MRVSGYTRNSARNSQISPTPSGGSARDLRIVGDGEGDGGRKAHHDVAADRQRLVMPRIADVGLEDLPLTRLHVVAERTAEISGEAHAASHDIAPVRRGAVGDGDVLRTDGQHAPV